MNVDLSRLTYNPDTGLFTWVRPASRRALPGATAGWLNDSGYILISLDGVKYRAHRLAWRYVYGCWPQNQIDHINGNRADNRIVNLREATDAQNRQNMARRSDNRSGYAGVYWAAWANKWRAEIRVDNKRYRLGYFDAAEDAYAVYLKAKSEFHTFNPTPRAA